MKSRVLLLSAFLTLAFLTATSSASAADLSGKWIGTMQSPGGQDLEINFDFKVSGEKLTGTVASSYGQEQISDGTVKDDAISFVVLAGGGQFKITYKGKVVGEDLKFNVSLGDMGDREMTAKRVK